MRCRCESCVEVRHFLESHNKGSHFNPLEAYGNTFFFSLLASHQAILFIHFIIMLLFIYKLAACICFAALILIFAVVFTFKFFTHYVVASGCDSVFFFFVIIVSSAFFLHK